MTAYEIPFITQGETFTFIDRARTMVYDKVTERLSGSGLEVPFHPHDVTAYWFSKDAKGWTVLLMTSLPDNIYYRVTHDKEARETSLDVFHKFDTQTFKDEEPF